MKMIITERQQIYSLSLQHIEEISQDIIQIGPQMPEEFSRKPRTLKYLKRYKATEFRQLMLYTLPIILKNKMAPAYYNHFLKIHCALRILCTPDDCVRNNRLAHQLIIDFLNQFKDLYHDYNISFNIHSMEHLAAEILHNQCPLDDLGASKFENFMQYLKKLPKTGFRVLEQINNRVSEKILFNNKSAVFQIKFKRNQINKHGVIKKLYFKSIALSVNEPNNYILINDTIVKITEILSFESNKSVNVLGQKLVNLNPMYTNPINSMNLNVYKCAFENFF